MYSEFKMKKVKCFCCADERIVEDNVILSVCGACQEEMKEVKEGDGTWNIN